MLMAFGIICSTIERLKFVAENATDGFTSKRRSKKFFLSGLNNFVEDLQGLLHYLKILLQKSIRFGLTQAICHKCNEHKLLLGYHL